MSLKAIALRSMIQVSYEFENDQHLKDLSAYNFRVKMCNLHHTL